MTTDERLDEINANLIRIEERTIPLLQFTEMVAEQPCTVRTKQDCNELPGYEKRLWCIPCRARETMKMVRDG